MALTKKQKEKIIGDLKDKIARQKAMVFATISGVKVKDLSRLRKEMKSQNCELKVAKKTLISLVLKDNKIEMSPQRLKGEVAIGFGYNDEIQPFKVLYNFSKENQNFKILGGFMGKEFVETAEAIALAQLPAKDQLLAQLVGSLAAPLSGIINVFQGNLRSLVYILCQLSKVRS